MSGIGLDSAPSEQQSFGGLLREWRTARGLSQLALSVQTGVSARHLSFMETGRASPSREMVLTLAQALDMPLRDRNAFLQSAGFAAIYRETPLEAAAMGPVRDAINLLLRSTEPNPTFVVNRRYDVLDANDTGRWLLSTFTEDLRSFPLPHNFGRLLVSAKGMRGYLENWEDVARKVLSRLKRELGGAHSRDAADEALLKTIAPTLAELGNRTSPSDPLPLLVPVHLRRASIGVRLFTTIATLGTPLDVTLQELRIEMLFPADDESRRVLETRTSAWESGSSSSETSRCTGD
jgi:transcriptional regulator with XRE-family HTH domain